jgi:hypothetical protein
MATTSIASSAATANLFIAGEPPQSSVIESRVIESSISQCAGGRAVAPLASTGLAIPVRETSGRRSTIGRIPTQPRATADRGLAQ